MKRLLRPTARGGTRRVPGARLALFAAFFWALTAAAVPTAAFHQAGVARDEHHAFVATFDSTAWFTLHLDWLHRLERAPAGEQLMLGAGLELPVLLWKQTLTLDTGRVGGRAAWLAFRSGRFCLLVEGETRVGVEGNNLATLVSWDATLSVEPWLQWTNWGFGLVAALQQGLATHLTPTDLARAAYEGRPDAALGDGPGSGWIAFPSRRVPLGLAVSRELGRLGLFAAGGLVLTPSNEVKGLFDAMALGVWPFFFRAGVSAWF